MESATSPQDVEQQDEESFEIHIRTLDSAQHTLRVHPGLQVLSLKQQVEALLHIPPQRQRLIFSGRVLKDERLVSDYGLGPGCVIHCVPRPAGATSSTSNDEPPAPTPANIQANGLLPGHGVLLGTVSLPPEANASQLMDSVLRGLGMQLAPPPAQPEGGRDEAVTSAFAAINNLLRQSVTPTAAREAGEGGGAHPMGESAAAAAAAPAAVEQPAWAFLRNSESLLESLALGCASLRTPPPDAPPPPHAAT